MEVVLVLFFFVGFEQLFVITHLVCTQKFLKKHFLSLPLPWYWSVRFRGAFYSSAFVYSLFPKRYSFFTVCLVHCLHEISQGWRAKEKSFEILVSRLVFLGNISWEYLHSVIFVIILSLFFFVSSGSNFCWSFLVLMDFWQNVDKKDTYNFPLCVFVSI